MIDDKKEIIHIEMVDAVHCWVGAKSKPLGNNIYSILEIDDFDSMVHEFGELYEFFPGDIVEAVEHTWSDGSKGKLATKLVTASSYPDRKLFDFLFKVWQRRIPFDKNTFNTYNKEINTVKKESAEGKVFNAVALGYLKELEQIAEAS